jgi:uncharacterized protein involved in exopolysaccharide biosynthesis
MTAHTESQDREAIAREAVARDAGDSRGDMLDLSALWVAIKRRRAWIVGPTLAALGLSFVAVNLVTPRYTGEARILLENRDSFYTRPGQGSGESSGQQFDSEAVQSQVQLIMSRDLAREAIKQIGLVGNPEFDSGAGALNALKKLGVLVGLGAHPADRSPEDRVLEKYFDRLLVYPVGRSRIVAVEFTSQDPALASKGANAIANAYLELQEAAKQDTARSASSWLSTTIEPMPRPRSRRSAPRTACLSAPTTRRSPPSSSAISRRSFPPPAASRPRRRPRRASSATRSSRDAPSRFPTSPTTSWCVG